VQHNTFAVSLFREQFKPEQAQSALSRLYSLLGHELVADIVGQETTLDFAKVMQERQIVLLKLAATLPLDVKRFRFMDPTRRSTIASIADWHYHS
jgi:hypothetical protein